MSQRQQQTTEQAQETYASSETTDGVTFSSGNMMVNGAPQTPIEVQNWESSNGVTNYSTIKWRDPETGVLRTSCNCPGWAMKKAGKPRSCKHTKDMQGEKTCRAKKVDTIRITNIAQAEQEIPKYDGRELRGIMLDWDDEE